MKPSPASCTKYLRAILPAVLLLALPFITPAQQKKPTSTSSSSSLNPPPPKSTPTPAAKPATPTPPKPADPTEHHDEHHGASAAHSGGSAGVSGANSSNSFGSSISHTNTATNKTNSGASGTNKSATGKSDSERTSNSTVPADPRAPTGLNLRSASGSTGTYKATGTTHTNTSTTAGGGKTGAAGAASSGNAGNAPGTTKLTNGGTKMMHADGSSVERNRSGKVTGVTTAKGATAKMDAHGNVTAIHDGKGMTISRGPHGERRIETTRADHSKLVSIGKQSGYAERHFNRGGHDYVQRSYYVNGRAYVRVYAPYTYMGYPYYGYVPAFYYMPTFYGWVYNPWPAPVPYVWGWYGAPWYAQYGYYFAPYPVYPSPAFWLADYALAESLRVAAEEAELGSLWEEPGFVYASAHVGQSIQDKGSPLVTPAIKDLIAEQVKQIIADEKDAAAKQGSSAAGNFAAPAVPPSLDPRFTLFIIFTELSLDTYSAACSVTAGDIIRRKDYAPDGENTVAVEVASSKNGDCAVGTASRLKVDDLEEMHDNLREKIDDGLKSLSENEGKGGIPTGPAANPSEVSEGQSNPDPAVADELKKQQEAADQTEKDVQQASTEGGSAD